MPTCWGIFNRRRLRREEREKAKQRFVIARNYDFDNINLLRSGDPRLAGASSAAHT